MSILQALAAHYDRLLAQGLAPEYGYSKEDVSFAIVLSPRGEVVDVVDIRDTSGKVPRPSRHLVPQRVIRASNVAPNAFWDKTEYALGVARERATGELLAVRRGEHEAFRALHLEILAEAEDEGLVALTRFLDTWDTDQYKDLPHAADMAGSNVVFRLDGARAYIHDGPAAREIWRARLNSIGGERKVCLVTGKTAPATRLHPKIKGVRGAQSFGASIVSFNENAFESFNRKQGGNAPVSEAAAFAYTTALNIMLAPNSRQAVRIGDMSTVFWAEAADGDAAAVAAEEIAGLMLDPPTDADESAEVADVLEGIAKGRPLEEVRPDVVKGTRFFVLGLAPNASRLSVRFWHEDTIGSLAGRVAEHWRDLRIEPRPWKTAPSVWRLLLETAAHGKSENIPPVLGGQLMRAILTGGRYPHSLFAAVIGRIRADKDINGRRAAILKACLSRNFRLGSEEEDISMSLDREDKNPAYLLGRLFAVYENIQKAAMGRGLNATIKDRYFGAASATPASVFPLLERSSAPHLALLRKSGSGGLAHWFDTEIDAILGLLSAAFPRSLRLEDQGRFAIGYHHQRGARRSSSNTENQTED